MSGSLGLFACLDVESPNDIPLVAISRLLGFRETKKKKKETRKEKCNDRFFAVSKGYYP